MCASDLAGGDDALVAVRRRHADIHDHNVWPGASDALEQRLGRSDRGDDVDARIAQEARNSLAEQHLVLGDHDSHGISTSRTCRSATCRSWMMPPAAPTRSDRRVWSAGSVSVVTASRSVPFSILPAISARPIPVSRTISATTK